MRTTDEHERLVLVKPYLHYGVGRNANLVPTLFGTVIRCGTTLNFGSGNGVSSKSNMAVSALLLTIYEAIQAPL
jgi:hypothetical protein